MANEAEQAIRDALANGPTFHPVDVTLLPNDWTLEPGDIVTVSNNGTDYDVPLFSLDYTWKGGLTAEAQSTGNQKREPLAALQKRYYGGGGGGGAWAASIMDKKFDLLASKVEWDNLKNGNKTMSTKLSDTDGKVGGIITNVGEDGTVTAKSIVDKINLSGNTVAINANHIILNGETVANSLAGQVISAKSLSAETLSASSGFSLSTGQLGGFTFNSNSITYNKIKIGTSSNLATVSCLMGGGADITLAHAHELTMNNGTVTAGQAVPIGDSSATFNVAATAWFQQQIAAAQQTGAAGVTLSQAGWDGSGKNIVTASNGATETVSLPTFTSSGGTTWSSGVTYVYFSTPSVSLPLLTKQVSLPSTSNWSASGSVSPPSSSGSITVRVGGSSRTFTWNGSSWS